MKGCILSIIYDSLVFGNASIISVVCDQIQVIRCRPWAPLVHIQSIWLSCIFHHSQLNSNHHNYAALYTCNVNYIILLAELNLYFICQFCIQFICYSFLQIHTKFCWWQSNRILHFSQHKHRIDQKWKTK